jgi:hypothetical protein
MQRFPDMPRSDGATGGWHRSSTGLSLALLSQRGVFVLLRRVRDVGHPLYDE